MAENEDDVEDIQENSNINVTNLIFLPFRPMFQLIVLITVVVKCILGPVRSVFPIVYCSTVMDENVYFAFTKYLYLYFCGPIYAIDTLLHILHRQITDEAMKRKYLPKSGYLLLMDIISLIPFDRLLAKDACPPVRLWPNILSYNEFLTIYRVIEYFSLVRSHSSWKLIVGFSFMTILSINSIGCFFLLLTMNALCRQCSTYDYDWRQFLKTEINEAQMGFNTYIYGLSFVFSLIFKTVSSKIIPSTILEFILSSIFIIIGSLVTVFFVYPKVFVESNLKYRRIREFQLSVKRVIEETKNRNPSSSAHKDVEHFYSLMWKTQAGVAFVPDIITQIPRYLRIEVKHDLFWSVFYHSPTLRKTSIPYKRWLCDYIRLDYKLPGEMFFTGPHCRDNLYYLKTGIVQLISTEDGTTPILSLTSGTVFGDISFLLPPLKRKVTVKCLTYCEVFYVSRADILKSLHKYPEDRKLIMEKANERIKHARDLYACKKHIKGLDRSEDEGIAYIKRRWWEIFDTVTKWKKKSLKKDIKCDLPSDEANYHCSKYLGQLVLCKDIKLQTKPLFANVKFPWILAENSSFGQVWNRIVVVTVFFVLILYPVNLTNNNVSKWFKIFQYWVNFVYMFDICLGLLTSIEKEEDVTSSFVAVMFERFKSPIFVLDLLATLWLGDIAVIIGEPEYYNVCQFNHLLKIYVLFNDRYSSTNVVNDDSMTKDVFEICFWNFSFYYISACFTYMLTQHLPLMSTFNFFKVVNCPDNLCNSIKNDTLRISVAWIFVVFFIAYPSQSIADVLVSMAVGFLSFVVVTFSKSRMIASLVSRYREISEYQFFVSNLKKYYKDYKIHHQLLKRLDDHLLCHWKYYKGMDVMYPNFLKEEPFHIYWKAQGESAAKILKESKIFLHADPNLIKEMAYQANFILLPRGTMLTLFGIHSKNLSWLSKGSVTCQFHNEVGELEKGTFPVGELIAMGSIFLGQSALRSYRADTECELLYIRVKDFFNVLKRYPNEWGYIENCKAEFSPFYIKIFEEYFSKYRSYRKKLRELVFQSKSKHQYSNLELERDDNRLFTSFIRIMNSALEPDSKFIHYWMLFRPIIAFVSILCASLQGGSGAMYKRYFNYVSYTCSGISLLDIILKMTIPYYDDRGLLIRAKKKCMIHYMCRGFTMDVIGAMPWHVFIAYLPTKTLDESTVLIVNTILKFSHLYLIMGYFEYIADKPSDNVVWVKILKWHVFLILLMFGASHYFVHKCIRFGWDKQENLIHMQRRNHCWLPNYVTVDKELTSHQLHLVFAHSLILAQSAILNNNLGNYGIEFLDHDLMFIIFALGVMFWFVMCYSVSLLFLHSRGNQIFKQALNRLRIFLEAERVNKKFILRVVAHFRYWWQRTNGINIQKLMNERIGVVYRQDLSYHFYKDTFNALGNLIKGGESRQRQLAATSTLYYFLPKETIIREMDLSPWVYVVHRGKVIITQDGNKLAVLTKGSIFGQLNGTVPRAIKVTAETMDYADVLQISIKDFQESIGDEIRNHIKLNMESKLDYMSVEYPVKENPCFSIEFLQQKPKSIYIPIKRKTITAVSGSWFSNWLVLSWLLAPFVASVIVLMINNIPSSSLPVVYYCLIVLDIIHFVQIFLNFFELEFVVVGETCVNRSRHLRIFQEWKIYIDILSLIVPMATLFTNEPNFQLARLLRLRLLYEFYIYFCKTKLSPGFMSFIVVLLVFHALSCGWMYVACRDLSNFPLLLPDNTTANLSKVDFTEWSTIKDRKRGCAKLTEVKDLGGNKVLMNFVVPTFWLADYVLATFYIIINYTSTNVNIIFPLTLSEAYYKIFVTFTTYFIGIWHSSLIISVMYMKVRELLQYDYSVYKLLLYLKHSGLSTTLIDAVKEYTDQLWYREKGNWLPELAKHSPTCLRQDMLSALYIHHLEAIPLFRNLPPYFTRQLVTRFQRVMIFPEKCIMQAGDIFSCIYFIHEGEVEKWYTDADGKDTMVSVLSTNSCFGLLPGLYLDIPYMFSYYSRTVVDLVYLKYNNWQDLLEGYPEVHSNLYAAAKLLKKEFGMKE